MLSRAKNGPTNVCMLPNFIVGYVKRVKVIYFLLHAHNAQITVEETGYQGLSIQAGSNTQQTPIDLGLGFEH